MKNTNKEVQDKLEWFLEVFNCDKTHHLPDIVLGKELDGDTQNYEKYTRSNCKD